MLGCKSGKGAMSCRMILAWMGFLGFVNVYFSRINLSMAIVEMMGPTTKNTSHLETCPDRSGSSTVTNLTESMLEKEEEQEEGRAGEFDWNQGERGLLLGSYYYGYTAMQIPCAWLSARFGFRLVYGLSLLVASLLTVLFPVAVRFSLYLGVAIRCVLGMFHAASFPAMAAALGVWSPPMETTKLNGIAMSGASAGTCIIFYLAGVVIDELGWEAIFYLTGGLSFLWVGAWFALVYDSPQSHPRIDKEEKDFIEKSIGANGTSTGPIPWLAIFTSWPVWGLMLGHASSNWGNYTLNQQLPTYLADVLRLDLTLTGLLSSVCYVLQWIVCVAASYLTDLIRTRGIMTTIRIRKINTFIGLWVTGFCVGLAGVVGCEVYSAVTLFMLSAGLNTFTVPGCKTSMLDIAPAYSGIVFAVSNTLSNVPGFVAPQVVGAILVNSTVTEWQIVFWVSCAVHVVGSLVYLIKGTDEVQAWAKDDKSIEGDGCTGGKGGTDGTNGTDIEARTDSENNQVEKVLSK